jgi:hypothetical protein
MTDVTILFATMHVALTLLGVGWTAYQLKTLRSTRRRNK